MKHINQIPEYNTNLVYYVHKLVNEPFLYIVYTVITNNNLGELRFQPRIFNTILWVEQKETCILRGHFCGSKILYDSSITYKKIRLTFYIQDCTGVISYFFQKSRIQLFLIFELNSILPYKENNKKQKEITDLICAFYNSTIIMKK